MVWMGHSALAGLHFMVGGLRLSVVYGPGCIAFGLAFALSIVYEIQEVHIADKRRKYKNISIRCLHESCMDRVFLASVT